MNNQSETIKGYARDFFELETVITGVDRSDHYILHEGERRRAIENAKKCFAEAKAKANADGFNEAMVKVEKGEAQPQSGAAEGVRVEQARKERTRQNYILVAWANGDLSEGQACKAMGVDRIEGRIWLDDAIFEGVKAADAMKGGDK